MPAADLLAGEQAGTLRHMTKLERTDYCIVLSNSCDNYAGVYQIILAPVVHFEFDDPPEIALKDRISEIVSALVRRCESCPAPQAFTISADGRSVCDGCRVGLENCTDVQNAEVLRKAAAEVWRGPEARDNYIRADQWAQVSRLATGHAKTFYLPDDPSHNFERGEVDLTSMFLVEPELVESSLAELGARRVFGLTPEATRHLQRTVDFFFSRHPRDDLAWPSISDLRLKLAWLDEKLSRGSERQAEYKSERAVVAEKIAAAEAT